MPDYPDYTSVMQIIGSDIMVPMDIQGAYIMLPMDIQSSYIQMPVDIQSQYITLDIDIVAQTVGNIAINIAASEVTLNVDITAQTVGNIAVNLAASAITLDINIKTSDITLNVDITAQSVGNIAVNIAASAITLNVNLFASAITLNIDINAQSVGIYSQPEWAAKAGTDKFFLASSGSKTWGQYVEVTYVVPGGKTLFIDIYTASARATSTADVGKPYYFSIIVGDQAGGGEKIYQGGNAGCGVSLNKPLVIPATQTFLARIYNRSNHTMAISVSVGGYEV